jgi:acyl-coenzyme A synthetase/AMP-(fatty) acid ligase
VHPLSPAFIDCTDATVLLQVRVLYTAPTLIRSLMQLGDSFVTNHDRSSLRILGTVGEPINPHAWEWYHHVSLQDCRDL